MHKLIRNNFFTLKEKGVLFSQAQINKYNKSNNKFIKTSFAKNSLPTFTYNHIYIHSKYDPVKEAKKFVNISSDYNLIVIIGFGFAYHIKETLAQIKAFSKPSVDNINIAVFEHESNILINAAHHVDLSFLNDKRIVLFIGTQCWNSFLLSLYKDKYYNKIQIVFLENHYRLFKLIYDPLINNINSYSKQLVQDLFTKTYFQKLWLKNNIYNFSNIFSHKDISSIFNKFYNLATLIVSAGPSLNNSLSQIQKIQNYIFIITTDTALPTLINANIYPDFIIALDSQIHNLKDFTATPKYPALRNVSIIYSLSTNSAIPNWNLPYNNNFYFATHEDNTKDSFLHWLYKHFNFSISFINTGSSVSTCALEIARLLGFSSIILVGQDLAYSNNITHAKDSAIYQNFLFHKQSKFNTINTLFYRLTLQRNPFTIGNVKTDFVLDNLLKWLADYAGIYNKDNNLIYNATKHGRNIPSITNITLDNESSTLLKEKDKTIIKKNILEYSKHKNKDIMIKKITPLLNNLLNTLLRFKYLLNIQNTQNIKNDIIIKAQLQLENEFPFMKAIIDNSIIKQNIKSGYYINIASLKNDISAIIKSLKKLLHKLNSFHTPIN